MTLHRHTLTAMTLLGLAIFISAYTGATTRATFTEATGEATVSTLTPTIRLVVADTTVNSDLPIKQGDEFWVEVRVDSVENLFGLAFKFVFDPSANLEYLMTEDKAESWIGEDVGGDILLESNFDASTSILGVGITRKAGQGNISGSGAATRIKMRMLAADKEQTNLSLQDVEANDADFNTIALAVVNQVITTDVEFVESDVPTDFTLVQNYPNPFNPVTTITYRLAEATHVVLKVFDMRGREVAALVDAGQNAGTHEVFFEGRDLPSGLYLYRLEARGYVVSKQMVLVK